MQLQWQTKKHPAQDKHCGAREEDWGQRDAKESARGTNARWLARGGRGGKADDRKGCADE